MHVLLVSTLYSPGEIHLCVLGTKQWSGSVYASEPTSQLEVISHICCFTSFEDLRKPSVISLSVR